MSSGIAYPQPTYIPPLPIFNPIFFPQSFGTTTTSGGGGGQTNIFPNGLTSGNVITMDGGTGGGGGTGVERTITGLSQIEWVDINSTIPTAITGYMVLNGNTLEIGSNTAISGINVNLLGSVVSANGVAIATGGNVSNDINNTFVSPATTQTFDTQSVVMDNSQLSFSNGGVINLNTTGNTSNLYFPSSFPTGTTGLFGGLGFYWNYAGGGGQGETDLICYGQQAGGSNVSGLNIYNCNDTTAPILVASFNASSSTIISNPTIPTSTTIGTLGSSPTATTYWVNNLYAPIASPTFTGTPLSTTPTTNDNSTRIATTSFVQSIVSGFTPITITSSAGTAGGTGTIWYFPISTTANYGNYFTYKIYANNTQPTITSPLQLLSGFYGTLSGDGIIQPFNNGITTINTYFISGVSNLGLNLTIYGTQLVSSGLSGSRIGISSTDLGNTFTLTMVIYQSQ